MASLGPSLPMPGGQKDKAAHKSESRDSGPSAEKGHISRTKEGVWLALTSRRQSPLMGSIWERGRFRSGHSGRCWSLVLRGVLPAVGSGESHNCWSQGLEQGSVASNAGGAQ